MSKKQVDANPCFRALAVPFVLLKIKHIYVHVGKGMGMDWLEVRLDGGLKIAATGYHAFVAIRDGSEMRLRADKLKPGDAIWVDTEAWPCQPRKKGKGT